MPKPLDGIRVIDLTWVLAGPHATRILADFGADVIKVESLANRDEARAYAPRPFDAPLGDRDPDRSGYFANFNRSKRAMTLNLKNAHGLALFKRLVAVADVVIENFSATVMTRFGLDYEGLSAINPRVIYISMAGFGHAGPSAHYSTYGSSVQALSGLSFMGGLPGKPASGFGHAIMDHFGAYNAVEGVLFALHHRNRTGRGQYIDLSQVQAATTQLGQYLLDYTVNGRPARRPDMPPGNDQHFPPVAPHGVYECQRPDTWVAIAVLTDDHWAGFRAALGNPDWAADPRFDRAASRFEHRRELDRLVTEWTRDRDRHFVMHLLQRHGVPAAAVQSAADLARDPQLASREALVHGYQPGIGPFVYDGISPKLSRTPGAIRGPAPRLAEHTLEVCREVLGIGDAEYEGLVAEGAF